MLRRLWRLLTKLFQQFTGNTPSKQRNQNDTGTIYPSVTPSPPTDTEIEIRFMQLLDGVHEGQGRDWVLAWLEGMESRISAAMWVEWLRRFEQQLLAAGGSHRELAVRMVRLGELGVGVVGDVALEIGGCLNRHSEGETRRVLSAKSAEEEEGVNHEDTKSAKEEEGEAEAAEVWFERGWQQYMAGDVADAVVSWGRAIEIKPDFHQAWYNRGVALGNLGRVEEAIADFSSAIEIKPDYHQAWYNRGVALGNLGRVEEAIADYSSAIEIKPDDHEACYNRGIALADVGRFEEAIADFSSAIEIKPDFHQACYNRGIALFELGRFEEAIADYSSAIEIKPDFHQACYNRGIALADVGRFEEAIADFSSAIKIKSDYRALFSRGNALFELGRFEEAIADYSSAIEIQPDYHEAWLNRGIAAGNSVSCDAFLAFQSRIARENPKLNQRGYDGELASYEEGLKYCLQDTHPEGWGLLHQAIGKAHYFRGRQDAKPRYYWKKAVRSYNQALKTLQEFPERHLEVLQDLMRVYLDLGKPAKAEELGRLGTDLFRRLLEEPNRSEYSKKQLGLKFAGFRQLTVDLAVQSGNWCAAWELAEQGKNACLSWLLSAWSQEISSPTSREILQLLNPTTAIVYWHISPYALHTFIWKHGATAPIVLQEAEPPNPGSPAQPGNHNREVEPPAVQRLREFEDWVKKWNQDYEDYRSEGKDNSDKSQHPWRKKMKKRLNNLENILNISTITQQLPGVTQLILIPHRDLHRFPLQALFPDDFTITYLPSAQMGLNLQHTNTRKTPENPSRSGFISVEVPDSSDNQGEKFASLPHGEIESNVINEIFAKSGAILNRIPGKEATQKRVTDALSSAEYQYFHFTGHGTYNFPNPKRSALALNQKDRLRVEDICQLDLSHLQIVSLSACETALTGNQTITDEYFGLASGFLRQGVEYFISTLWRVESISSALFMMEFYRCLLGGVEPAVAVKQTQDWLRNVTYRKLAQWYLKVAQEVVDDICIEDLKDEAIIIQNDADKINSPKPPYAHHYYWASFIVYGTNFKP
jgi:CHAT domain-containing protein/tetratricopeptide (TPR) repeat protein